ncbi:glycosyltransferase-like [Candidatus Vecturithrix granuli]|uniref:Glycosyltransferase-like n=1 Tax=Vecturithrix granuli TaxID=1499967 RepID=A0A081BW83_VECG1|nr:glycosyltransferase-like [Candidatus Vecturithrix granuli]
MLNILFVLYNTFIANSAIHIHHFANALCERGYDCMVAVPEHKETAQQYLSGQMFYTPVIYAEMLTSHVQFLHGREPDIIHVWTPREVVRQQWTQLKKKYPSSRLIIHLEDHEEVLLERYLNMSIAKFRSVWGWYRRRHIPKSLIHPLRYKTFLHEADGITLIIESLREFVPQHTPALLLWPIVEVEKFGARPQYAALRQELGIAEDELVLTYTGNVHLANADEVKSLYMAVASANQEGIPVRLVRTGTNYCDFLGEDQSRLQQYVVELGFLPGEKIPPLLAIADILIQPGKSDRFNEYRLPSKIPEFLATGKPVVAPQANIGWVLKDQKEAFLLKTGDAAEIVRAIKMIRENKELAQTLSRGARAFAVRHFDKVRIVQELEMFYEGIIKKVDKKYQ